MYMKRCHENVDFIEDFHSSYGGVKSWTVGDRLTGLLKWRSFIGPQTLAEAGFASLVNVEEDDCGTHTFVSAVPSVNFHQSFEVNEKKW